MEDGIKVGEFAPSGVGTRVENDVAVERAAPGVVTAGVTVGKPPTGMAVGEKCVKEGFCQIKTNALARTHKTNAPHPSPPKRNRSNVEKYFFNDSIKSMNESLLYVIRCF
jgi:hypothetical protein